MNAHEQITQGSMVTPDHPIAIVRTVSPNLSPTGSVTCYNPVSILYSVERAHPNDHVRVTAVCHHVPGRNPHTGFCFQCWQDRHADSREARRAELAAYIETGRVLHETRGTGAVTCWRYNAEEGTAETLSAVIPQWHTSLLHQTPDTIARHLESREYGFGWTVAFQHLDTV